MTPDEFEAMQSNQLLLNKVREKLIAGVTVNDADIEAEYRKNNEKVDLAFVRFSPGLYESRVKVDNTELEKFFADHREEFRVPDQVAIRYLQFSPAAYEDQITIDEAEIERYYQRHKVEFDIPEQVRVAHILIRVGSDADQATREKKKELAEKVLAEARAGKDFADLARKYSDDKASVAQGGDLGYFTHGTMVEAFEKVAFNLKPGEISDLVETPFGYHIIKGEGYIEAGIKPLVEVIDQVKQGLRLEKASQMAFEKAMDAYNINRKTGDLEAAAKANNLGIKETGLFSRGDAIEGIGNEPEVTAAAFALNQGELARPVNLAKGVLLIALKERRESHLPELADVRPAVEEAFRKSQGSVLARKAADDLLAALKKGQPLIEAAKAEKASVEETGDFARSFGDFVPHLGNAKELAAAAFDLTREAPTAPEVYEVGSNFVVAVLKDRKPADPAGLTADKRDELRQSLQKQKEDQAVLDKLNQLKQQATIMIAPAVQTLLNEG
jgi:peptidyl-prolyl cis-trans isomerase D